MQINKAYSSLPHALSHGCYPLSREIGVILLRSTMGAIFKMLVDMYYEDSFREFLPPTISLGFLFVGGVASIRGLTPSSLGILSLSRRRLEVWSNTFTVLYCGFIENEPTLTFSGNFFKAICELELPPIASTTDDLAAFR